MSGMGQMNGFSAPGIITGNQGYGNNFGAQDQSSMFSAYGNSMVGGPNFNQNSFGTSMVPNSYNSNQSYGGGGVGNGIGMGRMP